MGLHPKNQDYGMISADDLIQVGQKNESNKILLDKAAKINAKVHPQDAKGGIYADDLGDDANLNVKLRSKMRSSFRTLLMCL